MLTVVYCPNKIIMSGNSITIVIPARMASSRYPGKPLVPIMGLPLIEHVRRRALLAKESELVVVATCDESIKELVENAGGKAIMTKDTHERCTDRIEEAMENLPGDIVVMVQGDEPLLLPDAISAVVAPLLADGSLPIVNLLSPLTMPDDLSNPNIVKAVCNLAGDVIFFTRSSIPFFREERKVPVYRQTGIMAFRKEALSKFSTLPETSLERAESVDMLRAIEHGMRIAGVVVDYVTIGVDRPSDVAIVESAITSDSMQHDLFQSITVKK
jgi:3-deoxy-manno-octulosonate cytidylyltransferase (CMP-KDO synthetase)